MLSWTIKIKSQVLTEKIAVCKTAVISEHQTKVLSEKAIPQGLKSV